MVEKWRGPPEDSIISPKVEMCTKKKKKKHKTQNVAFIRIQTGTKCIVLRLRRRWRAKGLTLGIIPKILHLYNNNERFRLRVVIDVKNICEESGAIAGSICLILIRE